MPPSPTPRDPREEIADLLDGFPANEDELDAARDTWCDLDESEQRFQLARLAVARFRQGEAIRVSLARLERAATLVIDRGLELIDAGGGWEAFVGAVVAARREREAATATPEATAGAGPAPADEATPGAVDAALGEGGNVTEAPAPVAPVRRGRFPAGGRRS
jgi:hypothetical protein